MSKVVTYKRVEVKSSGGLYRSTFAVVENMYMDPMTMTDLQDHKPLILILCLNMDSSKVACRHSQTDKNVIHLVFRLLVIVFVGPSENC